MKKSAKKTIFRIAASVLVLVVLFFLFRGPVYRIAVKYEDAGGRKNYEVKDERLAKFINENLPNDEALDQKINIEMIVDFSEHMAAQALEFSDNPTNVDPNKTLIDGAANYEGYAAFSAAVGNFLINMYLSDEWEAKPRKSKLYLFGSNKTKDAKSGWFKDHDIVVFKNKNTKEEILIDPAAFDAYDIRRVDKYQK